jgi:hypothetical protein
MYRRHNSGIIHALQLSSSFFIMQKITTSQEIREETNNMAEMQPKSTDSNKNKKKGMARRKKAVIT